MENLDHIDLFLLAKKYNGRLSFDTFYSEEEMSIKIKEILKDYKKIAFLNFQSYNDYNMTLENDVFYIYAIRGHHIDDIKDSFKNNFKTNSNLFVFVISSIRKTVDAISTYSSWKDIDFIIKGKNDGLFDILSPTKLSYLLDITENKYERTNVSVKKDSYFILEILKEYNFTI